MFKTGIKFIAAAILGMAAGLAAAAYPERAITMITPFPAGGATDGLARTLAEHMAKTLGQSVVVENRAGAATTIGASHVSRATPDGYTILLATNSTLVTNRFLFKNLTYDPDAFAPIGMIGIGPMVLLSTKKDQFKSLADVVKAAKAQPGTLSIASFGAGTSSHLAAEYFQQLADIKLLHVPFKGSTQALPQLINGDVDLFFDMVSTGMPQVDAGKVDVQAITSKDRMSTLPKLATVSESGYPGFEMTAWFTLVAPPGTPQAATRVLGDALRAALNDEAVRKRMLVMGIEPSDGSPEALTAQIKQEIPIIQSLVKRANIAVQ
ncbi:Bug family tripartite tricarboxylate transporter substrate binding protein [Parapusillimonas granuli]|uniref:Tripartite tricarboxylate transporter substrate binding protein n=1 Tax=Parapusillimonas granuli TaxID=380911 RepID=A0A853G256_9BURK|nr:tripartite tricarboxylate transporter substrate binding protein [Parapusillimonas granuli]MBB5214512.1 tripartite-type tricarboxylate transporter receptor subunit TctC [Parapusillimonas granuli]MEB2398239.1 tripartite tricarboxylate transporter substrate binding protein [Alcaligenaceae bacterium]NYT49080.1 tripartite tricarboxylate transporter substrate binding protein [Parapusillimonas granuli]